MSLFRKRNARGKICAVGTLTVTSFKDYTVVHESKPSKLGNRCYSVNAICDVTKGKGGKAIYKNMLCYAWENSPIHKVVKSLQLNDLCFVFGVLVPTTYFSQLTGTKRKTYRLEIQYIVKYGNRDGETFSSTPLEDEDIVEEENDDYDF